jgi:tRNA-specific 2-thiouridylase
MSVPDIGPKEKLRATVKIRYHHQGEAAIICRDAAETVRVIFDNPVKAATPGQSAVFYDENNCVIGGGKIEAVI